VHPDGTKNILLQQSGKSSRFWTRELTDRLPRHLASASLQRSFMAPSSGVPRLLAPLVARGPAKPVSLRIQAGRRWAGYGLFSAWIRLDSNDDLPELAAGLEIAVDFRHLIELECPIDNRLERA
jgi:hypothetical protein